MVKWLVAATEVAAIEMVAVDPGEYVTVVERAIPGKVACSQVIWSSVRL